jgi:hypothetical protein
MTPVTLPTPIAQNINDEAEANIDSPLIEPAPQSKSDQGSAPEPQS